MAQTIQEVRNVLNEIRPQLMQKPNVRATGIGYKRMGAPSLSSYPLFVQ
ncbi:hypothetical protein SAMN06265218_102324 [Fodinibius sediminis]|uniref:Uncharacterized protein n=1 Tax=Fodinibius sediminis TaxID=1214077 RepID=A0A521B9A6_9BACT|nr:hypothetical protein SAMN06265218_102324 [Fodinibius sediminis]